MIVNQQPDGWEIIYHRAHALLAAKLAANWRRSDRPVRLIETIAAIFNHDDLEREWEGDHIGPTGVPLDFTLSDSIAVDKLRHLVEGANYRGRWVALLTSMHLSFLFEPSRGTLKELDAFLDEQANLQKELRTQLGAKQNEAEEAYAFLQWCDRLSLILTRRQIPERERQLEISLGHDGERYYVTQRSDESLVITPWPFEDDTVTVGVEASYVTQVTFKDNDELAEALKQADIRALEWTFRK